MLGEKGFNELDMALLKHLIHNKKPCCFVRTQCDSQINGMMDQNEFTTNKITAEMAFKKLKDNFRKYMKTEVLSQTNLYRELGLFSIEYV